jgi:acetylornithine/succinyldiaminopimelate/putrescine aminotransferase
MMVRKLASDTCGPLMTLAGFGHGLLTIYANNDQSVNWLPPALMIEEDEVVEMLEVLNRMLTWLGEVA